MKHLIIEGPDRVGKNTQIKNLTDNFSNVVIRHFRSPKGNSNEEKKQYQQMSFEIEYMLLSEFRDMKFDLCIWNRGHIGEVVYGQLYRNSEPESWVFTQEERHVNDDTYLLLLTASPEFLSIRDDGKSFSSSVESRAKEIELFRKACHDSNIKHVLEIEVEKEEEYLDPDFITTKILDFLNL